VAGDGEGASPAHGAAIAPVKASEEAGGRLLLGDGGGSEQGEGKAKAVAHITVHSTIPIQLGGLFMTESVLIADDLTGACDAAGPFAAAGLRTVARLVGEVEADVVAYSTDSRDVDGAEARRRLCGIAGAVRRGAPRIIFKKIDSTLRGNTGHEVVAALEAFGCDAAVVTPAFPAMGRVVEAGHLRVTRNPGFEPMHVAEYLKAHGATDCRHVAAGGIAEAIDGGARFVTLDAVCAEELDAIAAELLGIRRRILWAGSAGLAGALARRLGKGAVAWRAPRGAVRFCIGSDHPVTVEQVARLGDASVRIPRLDAGVREWLGTERPATLFLSGGDTASAVCRALGVERIEVAGEFAPGIPVGILRGGMFDGVTVITKSGGFGDPDVLISIAEYFHG